MFSFIIFILSGVVVAFIIFFKVWEMKKRKSVWVLRLISRGDERFKSLSHKATHKYLIYKEKSEHIIKKQIPLRAKNFSNKAETLIRQKFEDFLGDIRNTRLLNKRGGEGISEFFQNMKNMEEETAEAIKDMDQSKNGQSLDEKVKKG